MKNKWNRSNLIKFQKPMRHEDNHFRDCPMKLCRLLKKLYRLPKENRLSEDSWTGLKT